MELMFANWTVLAPELVLAGGAILCLLLGAIGGDKLTPIIEKLGIAVLVAACASVVMMGWGAARATFAGSFVFDDFALFLKLACFGSAAFALCLAPRFFHNEALTTTNERRYEFTVLILLCAVGMGVMVSAHDFITLYLGLELQSLSIYVLASIQRDHLKSSEAGLKYFVLGALSSGMLLYGISLIYGYTGQIDYTAIAATLSVGALPTGLIFGLVFLLAGIAFKLSAVPFHMWAPDVYEGAPTPVVAFIASAPKIAATAMLVRVLFTAFGPVAPAWTQIITFISIASMALGAFAAIGQQNIKRLLAYSSIGHMGYMLLGLAGGNEEGVRGVLIYMLIYSIMTLGAFALVLSMRRSDGTQIERIDDLSGLARTQPMTAFMFAMLLFSLAGIPPLAGFFAKYFVFMAAVKAGLFILAVIGVVTSVVGAFYYLRLVKLIYFDEPNDAFAPAAFEQKLVLYLSGAFVLLFVLMPSAIVNAAAQAAHALF